MHLKLGILGICLIQWTLLSDAAVCVLLGGAGNSCPGSAGNAAIVAGNGNVIESNAGNNAILTCSGCTITAATTINGQSAITSGASNTITSQSSTIVGGSNNLVSGERSTIIGGVLNVASGAFSAVVSGSDNVASGTSSYVGGSGTNQLASAHHAAVFAGQFGAATADFSVAVGSFAKAKDKGSVVVSAKNTADNTAASDDLNEDLHCQSLGENTIHLCSNESEGVYVNNVSILGSISRLQAENEALGKALNVTEAVLADLIAGIRAECLVNNGKLRRLQGVSNDCFPENEFQVDELLLGIAIGASAVLLLTTYVAFKQKLALGEYITRLSRALWLVENGGPGTNGQQTSRQTTAGRYMGNLRLSSESSARYFEDSDDKSQESGSTVTWEMNTKKKPVPPPRIRRKPSMGPPPMPPRAQQDKEKSQREPSMPPPQRPPPTSLFARFSAYIRASASSLNSGSIARRQVDGLLLKDDAEGGENILRKSTDGFSDKHSTQFGHRSRSRSDDPVF